MATLTIVDYRRQDQRRYIYQPYWISSGEFVGKDCEDKGALLFSFPAAKYGDSVILIEKVCCQVTIAFTAGTTIDIGSGTLATDAVTTDGDVTKVDDDEYVPQADITATSAANYFAATGDWITAKLLMTELTPVIITPADTTVPCVYALCANASTIAAGKGRVHMLITEVPLAA